jgi:hypothetical protein
MHWLIDHFDRVLIGVVCLSLVAIGAGCAALTPTVAEADEVNTGLVGKAELNAVKNEIKGLIELKTDNTRKITQDAVQEAKRDAIQSSKTGMGDWGMCLIVLLMKFDDYMNSWPFKKL